ncbi:thioredoxin [Candidatus Woesearchaeota archaeon]|nr:thioredoxin [Candidatus Woesearchaeota archaeon]
MMQTQAFIDTMMRGKVVLDFYADWCVPCQRLQPILDKLKALHSEVSFLKVNVDNNQGVADEFAVRSIPTIVFLKDGEEKDRVIGLLHENGYEEKIHRAFRG